MRMRSFIMTLIMLSIIVFSSLTINAEEILFEDEFEGDYLADHWWISSMLALVEVNDGKMFVDQGEGDVYIDLDGYTFEGDYTVEIKFTFSSDREAGLGNCAVWVGRPQDYIQWTESEGNYIAVRRFDGVLCYWMKMNCAFEKIVLTDDNPVYDKAHILKVSMVDGRLHITMDGEVQTPEEGVELLASSTGQLSLTVYNSLVTFDYIKVYR